jgi:DnaJ-class molecular chaperone
MEKIKKTKIVEYDAYKTSDGREFTSKDEAQLHEDKLKGNKKNCPDCSGKGRINERYEKEWHNTSWIPTEGEYVQVKKSDECPKCKGRGFLELKWT